MYTELADEGVEEIVSIHMTSKGSGAAAHEMADLLEAQSRVSPDKIDLSQPALEQVDDDLLGLAHHHVVGHAGELLGA